MINCKRLTGAIALIFLTGTLAMTPAQGWALTTTIRSDMNPDSEADLAIGGGILDTLYGLSNLMRIDDNEDQIWKEINGGVTAKAKYAGYDQDFGYIPGTSGGSFVSLLQVFGSPSFTCSPATCSSPTFFVSGDFRFADDPSGAPLWSSQISDNTADPVDPMDHMVTWQIISSDKDHDNNAILGNFVLAFEDLEIYSNNPDSWDQDFNDLVVELHGVEPSTCTICLSETPVPEPATLFLLGSGLLGLGFARRRKRT